MKNIDVEALFDDGFFMGNNGNEFDSNSNVIC